MTEGNPDIYDSRAYFGQLGRDWKERLRNIQPYVPVVSEAGLVLPDSDAVSGLYVDAMSDWRGLTPSDSPETRSFYDAYGKYQQKVKNALQTLNAVPIRQRFADFAAATGLGDYEPAVEYNNPGAFNAALHDIYAHQIPFEAGFAPDYRNFYAGKTTQGKPSIIPANSVFPLNENLAEIGERDLGAAFRGNAITDPTKYKDVISGRNTDSFRLAALSYGGNYLDPASKALLDTRVELAYPTEYKAQDGSRLPAPGPVNAQLNDDLIEAGRLFQQKYVLPAAQQMRGLIKTQFPGLSSPSAASRLGRSVDILPNRYLRFLQELDKQYGGTVGDLGNFFYSADPVTAAARGIPEALSAVRRTPSSLLPGAADLIPSPEAIRTGYAKGPVAMGKQMAQEFVQSLPASIAAAGALSTPVAAPLAPGIGAGLVGTAAARAVNEVVRQQTGEGVVPKLRQALGTAPRTGVADRPRVGPQPLTAQVRPLTTDQRAELNRQRNRSELQRRIDLVKERFNPARGEFGLSEAIFGR